MNEVDKYIDSIFRDVDNKTPQIKELKEEMKIHLTDAINELQLEGKKEEEAINIAIKRFGEPNTLAKTLLGKLQRRVNIIKWLLRAAIFFLIASLLIAITGFVLLQQYNNTEMQIEQLIASHDGKTELTEQDKLELKQKLESNPVYSKVDYVAVINQPPMGAWQPIYGEDATNFRGGYAIIVTGSQDWQIAFRYRGYRYLIYYYLIIPQIFIGLVLLLFIIGKILNSANRKRLYNNFYIGIKDGGGETK